MYTVGESALYTNQGQYYAANAGAAAATGAVGYSTAGGHYLVQQTVDGDTLIATARNSPQTTSAVSPQKNFFAPNGTPALTRLSGSRLL